MKHRGGSGKWPAPALVLVAAGALAGAAYAGPPTHMTSCELTADGGQHIYVIGVTCAAARPLAEKLETTGKCTSPYISVNDGSTPTATSFSASSRTRLSMRRTYAGRVTRSRVAVLPPRCRLRRCRAQSASVE